MIQYSIIMSYFWIMILKFEYLLFTDWLLMSHPQAAALCANLCKGSQAAYVKADGAFP